MPTITVGANSYETLTEANDYLDGQIYAKSWKTKPQPDRERALITAFRDIQTVELIDPDTGVAIDPADAPQGVKDAQSELAFAFIEDPSLATGALQGGSNTRRVKAGSAEVEFFRPEDGGRWPPIVLRLLAPFMPASGATFLGSYATGADGCSSFEDQHSGLVEGYQ